MASGRASISASRAGLKPVCGSASLQCLPRIAATNISCSIPAWCAPTSRPPPEKGGQALGRSRGGLTTKIHLLADTLGRPLRFILTAGQANDLTQAPALLHGQTARRVIADRGYDSNAVRQLIAEIGAKAVIPSKCSRLVRIRHDVKAYRLRNRIERCFNRLKHFRRIATRYDRRDLHFLAALHLVGALQWLPANVDSA